MPPQDIEKQIRFGALAPFFQTMRKWAIFTTVVPLTTILVLWPYNDPTALLIWLFAVLLGIAAKYALTTRYQWSPVDYLNARPWHICLLLSTAYLGALWVTAILTFFPEQSPPHQVFIITLAVALGIGSISSGTHWLPLFYVYGVPILTALIFRLALVGEAPYFAMAGLMVMALLATIGTAKQLHTVFCSEMKLHFSSDELARESQVKTREAEEAVFAKSRILATASHDLRQPLHALSLYVDALRSAPEHPGDERERIFRRLDTCLDMLRKQFDGILDISRLDANVVQPERHHFDISECITNLKAEYDDKAHKKNLSFRVRAPNRVIHSDRALLERILRNLITNGLRYTREGGVLLAARPRNDHVLIQVIDTGVGIPMNQQDKAFIEFQRLAADSGKHENGLGFGLAIVRRLCELLDHPLTLQSRVNRGSIFSLQVPIGDSAQVPEPKAAQASTDTGAARKLVFVIDDDSGILDAMNTLLSKWGLAVMVAESLEDLLHKMPDTLTPDLILSDLSLREAPDGIETIRQLRHQLGPEIPAILISGTTDADKLQRARAAGLQMVQKPISPSALRSIVNHQLFVS